MHDSSLTIRPGHPLATSLESLRARFDLEVHGEIDGRVVSGITHDSRDVRPGDVYVAMPGSRHHGADFSQQVVEAGAAAIITDAEGLDRACASGLPVLVSSAHPRLMLGDLASEIYGTADPEPLLLGVTGTNGKTSVIYMLDAILHLIGYSTGISTTAERRIGDLTIESDLTSPEASELHALIARMIEERVDAVSVEISAQAVARHRITGLLFDVVAFNNFSQDHLDDFGDMETYFQAKAQLFRPQHAKQGVIVVDSPYGQRLAKQSEIPVTTLSTTYGQEADWHLAITRHDINGVSFVLQGPEDAYIRGRVPVFGAFMAENAALAIIMLHQAGVELHEIAQKLARDTIPVQIPGRLELMNPGAKGPRFYVDYGHTPGSFDSMLDALADVAEGRIIFMFGADGDRDTTKREEMGRIAAQGSHVLIVCDYHPRFEDPAAIRQQLLAGARLATSPVEIHEVADPREAIRFAISVANDDDVIVYAGPGHETTQEVAGNMIPYSARDEVRAALREAGKLN